MTGSRGERRTSLLRLATEPTKAAFCITAFFDVNHSSLLAFQGLRLQLEPAVGIQKLLDQATNCLWAAGLRNCNGTW